MRLPSYEIDHALGELRAAAEDPDELRLRPLLELALAVVRGDPTIDHHRLVDGATPYLSASGFAVAACVSNIEHRLTCTFYSDEWVHVCAARSRVEALRTLWPGVSASLSPLFLDTEVADDMLRQKGAHEGWLRDGEIPSGTPVSHFWWWLPREPPGYAAVVREAALRALKDAPRSAAPEHAIRPFLDYAFRLVRGELRDDAFVAEAAPAIPGARLALVEVMLALDALLTTTFYGQEWVDACTRRSCLEAVRTAWGSQLGGPGAPQLDCETVDDLMRQKATHEGGLSAAEIPPGTPRSHFWWWLGTS